jgi:hypothetical protein
LAEGKDEGEKWYRTLGIKELETNNMTESPTWPNFFIVGVAKAGTTSLHNWLKEHPQVYMSPVKEPTFFARDLAVRHRVIVKDQDEYLHLFSRARGYKAIGEASIEYFRYADPVAKRIKQMIPHAKIIILLRDPIERAYSRYLMSFRRGRATKSFYDALRDPKLYPLYVLTYTGPVRQFLKVFGVEHVLVLMFEELKKEPRKILLKTARFLNIDPDPMAHIKLYTKNRGGIPRGRWSRWIFSLRYRLGMESLPLPKGIKPLLRRFLLLPPPSIDPNAVDYLRPIFEKDLAELEKLLGRPLPELRKVW